MKRHDLVSDKVGSKFVRFAYGLTAYNLPWSDVGGDLEGPVWVCHDPLTSPLTILIGHLTDLEPVQGLRSDTIAVGWVISMGTKCWCNMTYCPDISPCIRVRDLWDELLSWNAIEGMDLPRCSGGQLLVHVAVTSEPASNDQVSKPDPDEAPPQATDIVRKVSHVKTTRGRLTHGGENVLGVSKV